MSSTASRIDEIVDRSAAVAAGITGIVAVWGCGSGLVTDPNLTPGTIRPFGSNPPSEFHHVSAMPDAPTLVWEGVGSVVVTWRLPMRLYLRTADLATLRRTVAPFYGRYLTAFAGHLTLSGTCEGATISSFLLAGDADWAWLDIELSVRERLNLPMAA